MWLCGSKYPVKNVLINCTYLNTKKVKHYSYLVLLALIFFQCRHKEENTNTQFPGKPEAPSSIKKEHENLLARINKLASLKDSAGRAAGKLQNLMQHHFTEEEDYVLPQLGLLPLLASGKLPDQSNEVIQLSEKLQSNLSHLSVEHQFIKACLDELKQVAAKEDMPEIIEFEKEIQKHAHTEEEVLFPAAVLVGEYLKLKFL
jgi:hypothetical protein